MKCISLSEVFSVGGCLNLLLKIYFVKALEFTYTMYNRIEQINTEQYDKRCHGGGKKMKKYSHFFWLHQCL